MKHKKCWKLEKWKNKIKSMRVCVCVWVWVCVCVVPGFEIGKFIDEAKKRSQMKC